MIQHTFSARLVELQAAQRAIDTFAAQYRLGSEDCHRLVLITEELFVNTVRHGYGGECDDPVFISLRCTADLLELRFEDQAPPFDPLQRRNTLNLGAEADARPVGGLGVFLTLNLSCSASYRREGERNVIELSFVRRDPRG